MGKSSKEPKDPTSPVVVVQGTHENKLPPWAGIAKAALWPLAALVAFFSIRPAFMDLIDRTDRFAVQGVAISTDSGISDRVRIALQGLDPTSVGFLIRTKGTGSIVFPMDAWERAYERQTAELRERGLIDISPGTTDRDEEGIEVRFTDLGLDAADHLFTFVRQSLQSP